MFNVAPGIQWVRDFDESDKIDLTAFHFNDFNDFRAKSDISESYEGVRLAIGPDHATEISVKGLMIDQIGAEDFIF